MELRIIGKSDRRQAHSGHCDFRHSTAWFWHDDMSSSEDAAGMEPRALSAAMSHLIDKASRPRPVSLYFASSRFYKLYMKGASGTRPHLTFLLSGLSLKPDLIRQTIIKGISISIYLNKALLGIVSQSYFVFYWAPLRPARQPVSYNKGFQRISLCQFVNWSSPGTLIVI